MTKNVFLLLGLSFFLFSCNSSKVTFNMHNAGKPLTMDAKIAFLNIQHPVPANAHKIGEAKYQNLGSPNNCDFDSNLIDAEKLARHNGANIVKVIKNKIPDTGSPCHRTQIEFYYYDGDITSLPQYQLQIN